MYTVALNLAIHCLFELESGSSVQQAIARSLQEYHSDLYEKLFLLLESGLDYENALLDVKKYAIDSELVYTLSQFIQANKFPEQAEDILEDTIYDLNN